MSALLRTVAIVVAVALVPTIAAERPADESCDPDAVYAGEEFSFGQRLRPMGASDDGFIGFTFEGEVDLEEVAAFLLGTASDGVALDKASGALVEMLSDGVALGEVQHALVEIASENGVVWDELEGTRAYVKLRHVDQDEDHGHKRKVYVYAIWGTLGELCG